MCCIDRLNPPLAAGTRFRNANDHCNQLQSLSDYLLFYAPFGGYQPTAKSSKIFSASCWNWPCGLSAKKEAHLSLSSYFKEEIEKPSVDFETLRFLVGGIAMAFAVLVQAISPLELTSISSSYFAGDWSRNFFVGCLFAIALFLFAYNGEWRIEIWLSKIAALAALGIAVFPCNCSIEIRSVTTKSLQCLNVPLEQYAEKSLCLVHAPGQNSLHWTFAGVLFAILAIFCLIFYVRAKEKEDQRRKEARKRMVIYAFSLLAILISIVTLLIDEFSDGWIRSYWCTFVFWAEFLGLFAFGFSWITASKAIPGLANPEKELWPKIRHSFLFEKKST